MGLGTVVGETALELVKSENIQNKTAGLMGMLFHYAGLTKKAVNMYIGEIEKSKIIRRTLCVTDALQAEKSKQEEEMAVLVEMTQNIVAENARVAQD